MRFQAIRIAVARIRRKTEGTLTEITPPDGDEQVARTAMIAAAHEAFAQHFGATNATGMVHAPGRVNLIGDHTDYNGLPVFPMAIQRGVVILFRSRDDTSVRLANLDPRFPPRTFELGPAIRPDPPGDWANYVKAAAQALAARHGPLTGFDGLVASDLPVAQGLSSSSAVTVGSALALLQTNGIEMQQFDLMSLLAIGERYVGTEGGGMDQAICLGGRRHTAFRIDFDPLSMVPTTVPANWKIVVASSLVEAKKSGAAQHSYNLRGRECRAALEIMRGVVSGATEKDGYRELLARASVGELLLAAEQSLEKPLRQRFSHVVTEATRVGVATDAMAAGDLATFGRLMSESHASLRDDFEVSCGALDELVETALAGGASGARLTGAGFGGCVVALCHVDKTPALVEHLTTKFYEPRGVPDALAGALLVAEASDGARVTEL